MGAEGGTYGRVVVRTRLSLQMTRRMSRDFISTWPQRICIELRRRTSTCFNFFHRASRSTKWQERGNHPSCKGSFTSSPGCVCFSSLHFFLRCAWIRHSVAHGVPAIRTTPTRLWPQHEGSVSSISNLAGFVGNVQLSMNPDAFLTLIKSCFMLSVQAPPINACSPYRDEGM